MKVMIVLDVLQDINLIVFITFELSYIRNGCVFRFIIKTAERID